MIKLKKIIIDVNIYSCFRPSRLSEKIKMLFSSKPQIFMNNYYKYAYLPTLKYLKYEKILDATGIWTPIND